MLKVFEKNIKKVRLRCSINLLLKYAGQVLVIAGLTAIIAVMIEKLLALSVISPSTFAIFSLIFLALILGIWLYKQPTRLQISLLLDERMKLKERFSTNLKLSEAHDAFSEAARNEAIGKAESLNLKGHFPIRLSWGWAYSGALWLSVVVLFAYMPQKDLLGIIRQRNRQRQAEQQKEEAKTQVKEATASVKLAMSKMNDPNVAEALKNLGDLSPNARPEDVKKEAIRQLGDLSEKMKNMQKSSDLASMKAMQQMLKQLKGSPESFSLQLRSELSKGNFGQAAALLRKMQKDLAEGNLSEEQKKQLAQQMQALAKALEQLAQQSGEFEKELEKMGLSKELAQMGEKELRQALQKQGLSADKIEDLLNNAAASNRARNRLAQMAGAMAGSGMGTAGGLTADELADAIDQLDDLESLQQQMMLTEASLNELARAMNSLGQGMIQGLGQQSPWREGDPTGMGPGSGGPGISTGSERASDDEGEFGTKKEKVTTKGQPGPVIASWYFKDMQVEGESRLTLSDVIQTGRDSAAEAISENEIPRRYEDAIKSYFGSIEESVPALQPDGEQE
ncbi:MAG: hypothetical protein P8016_01910 [Sedimentisphaerales bacterium]